MTQESLAVPVAGFFPRRHGFAMINQNKQKKYN
jgi:hypothetical protein